MELFRNQRLKMISRCCIFVTFYSTSTCMRPNILVCFSHFSVRTRLGMFDSGCARQGVRERYTHARRRELEENQKLGKDYATYKVMMMTAVILLISPEDSVAMRVCRRTSTSSALQWASPQRTAATSKLSSDEFEDTLSSPFIFLPGEALGHCSWKGELPDIDNATRD